MRKRLSPERIAEDVQALHDVQAATDDLIWQLVDQSATMLSTVAELMEWQVKQHQQGKSLEARIERIERQSNKATVDRNKKRL